MRRSYVVPGTGQPSRQPYRPNTPYGRPGRTLGYVALALLGLAVGVLLYVLLLFDQPLRTRIRIVDWSRFQPVSLDAVTLPDDEQTDLSWGEGGRTRVYVHEDFPLAKVERKDPLVENILVFGVDARRPDDVVCRADSLIIVTIDQRTGSIKLTSIMRDSQVAISGRSRPDRINAAYAYGGVGLLINTINQTLDLDIQRFAMFDFWSAANLIDAAGGIEIDVQEAEIDYANQSISEQNRLLSGTPESELLAEPGLQLLDGRQAVAWARIRKLDSDSVRTSRQRIIMMALIQEVSTSRLSALMTMASGGLGAFETNMRLNDIVRTGLDALPLSGDIRQLRIPQEGLYTVNPDPWMMIVDWEKQRKALHDFLWEAVP